MFLYLKFCIIPAHGNKCNLDEGGKKVGPDLLGCQSGSDQLGEIETFTHLKVKIPNY